MDAEISFLKATPHDATEIKSLLQHLNLPTADIQSAMLADFFIAKSAGKIIGVGGLETYHPFGLLRSLAVREDFQRRGIGLHLQNLVIQAAKEKGITQLYLLTETAGKFFEKSGFEAVDRASVPENLKQAPEFSQLCSTRALCLTRKL